MRKTDKKREKMIVAALTEVCDVAQLKYQGFEWLTHFIDFDRYPDSLSIVCVYDTKENLVRTDRDGLCSLIKEKLLAADIKLKDVKRQVSFDTEEQCLVEHGGKWNERFK